jgi:hypothetical protein
VTESRPVWQSGPNAAQREQTDHGYPLTPEQREQALKTQEERRAKRRNRPEFDWDAAIASLRQLLDDLYPDDQ